MTCETQKKIVSLYPQMGLLLISGTIKNMSDKIYPIGIQNFEKIRKEVFFYSR